MVGVSLRGADLCGADLAGAVVEPEQMATAVTNAEARLPAAPKAPTPPPGSASQAAPAEGP
jgi:hypothetical protein